MRTTSPLVWAAGAIALLVALVSASIVVAAELLPAVRRTTAPAHASLWLRRRTP